MEVKLRWPKELWERISNAATAGQTSIQTVVTKAVLNQAGIESWKPVSKKVMDKQVAEILEVYKEIPTDLVEAIDNAKWMIRSKKSSILNDEDVVLESI